MFRRPRRVRRRRFVSFASLQSSKGSGTRAVIYEKLDNAGIRFRKAIEFGNTETVKKAVAAGIGISILSEAAIRNEVAAGQMRAVAIPPANGRTGSGRGKRILFRFIA
ncbi:MAG: LysR substrate-binding domain-containing protein [Pseudomonadota bacterium]